MGCGAAKACRTDGPPAEGKSAFFILKSKVIFIKSISLL